MIRLEKDDFDNEDKLKELAKVSHVSTKEFKEHFHHVVQ